MSVVYAALIIKDDKAAANMRVAFFMMSPRCYMMLCVAPFWASVFTISDRKNFNSFAEMVNSSTMNIDVREYLRINPISVHDLTLSGDFKDCFLFFPTDNESEGGYNVYTQRQMFDAIMESIFQDLIESAFDLRRAV